MDKQRNYGIDLLRIVTMIEVVVLHILGHGGVLENTITTQQFNTSWLLEIIAYPAVNCFLLISGFVGCKRVFPSFKSTVILYLTVLFYSVTMYFGIAFFTTQTLSIREIGNVLMPVTTNQYWFFTCYMGMLVITPIINGFVNTTDKKTLQKIGITIFLIFSMYSAVSIHYGSGFKLNDGYSTLWFISLYTLGAIINKIELYKKISIHKAIIAIGIAIFITWLVKINTITGASELLLNLNKSLLNYTSPTIVIVSIMLVCIFVKIKINNKHIIRIITTLSTSAFSIYLIHDNKYIRNSLIKNTFKSIGSYSSIKLILSVLASAISIFVIGVIIDKIRVLIFRIFKVEKICDIIQKKLNC